MLAHVTAGVFAIAFSRLLDRRSMQARGRRLIVIALVMAVLVLAIAPVIATAQAALPTGATVRVRSHAIDAGWHTGRIVRDDRECAVIELDRPASPSRATLPLQLVDALQLGRVGDWTAIDAQRLRSLESEHCLEVRLSRR